MIVATAGHVDHGKTSLVRNLTGVETDRLEEEQRRGLSISLGYAYWRPDDRTTIGFIDVPGHRRFINNMISGISGIDLGLLVVAADDGPMPQTAEHLQVMRLLGVEDYILVISKTDRVNEQEVTTVCDEMISLLPDATPVYKISNTTGDGIEELRSDLEARAREWSARSAKGLFRMSIDRAFTLPGLGLIVTGTVASGVVENGETLVLQPQGIPLRVRNIHAHDKPAAIGRAGERCALNVSGGVHKDDIERGDWIVTGDAVEATTRFDARIRLLRDAPFPLKHLASIKLHIGAKHCPARMLLLRDRQVQRSGISPGESAFTRIITDRPVHCCHGDRFLVRDHGETATLGGGIVLDPRAPEDRKSNSRIDFLAAMEQDDIRKAILDALKGTKFTLNYDALLKSWNVDTDARPGSALPGLARIGTDKGELWLDDARWSELKQDLVNTLRDYHDEHPDEPGIRLTMLARKSLSRDDRGLFQPAVVELIKSGVMTLQSGLLSTTDFRVSSGTEVEQDWQSISGCLRAAGRQIPNLVQLREASGLTAERFERVLDQALRDRRLVKINAERAAEPSQIGEFAGGVLDLTSDGAPLRVAELRDRLGCGRNVLVDILEYFDSLGFTRRTGDARIVLDRGLPARLFR